MIAYRSQERVVRTAEVLRAIAESTSLHDVLIRFGELEAGAADAGLNEADAAVLRHAAIALGRCFYRRDQGLDCRATLDRALSVNLPAEIRISVPEGYAFYALYPETYLEAARQFFAECRPQRVCVIGIRSIGTSLSAVVAGALEELGCETGSCTVRPTGHPFERRLDPGDPVRQLWERLSGSHWFAVVDEGPGLSGSSFLSVTRALAEAGVPLDRVVLFPSWHGDAARFINREAAAQWPQYRKFCGSFQLDWITGGEPYQDLSGGKWREFLNATGTAANPQQEARKYLLGSRLFKFAGLGHYGQDRFERAQVLGAAGFSPPAVSLQAGFIEYEFVPGRPALDRRRVPENRIAEYLAFRRHALPARARSVSFDELAEMIAVNTSQDAGDLCRAEFEDRPAAQVDSRMLPHEWIDTAAGWLKTDSTDHCCDHFFPGYVDIAWDLAGAAVEFRMNPAQKEALLSCYRALSGDRVSNALIGFYEIAYLAFRLGYTSFAAGATSGTADHDRFAALQHTYSHLLKRRLAAAMEDGQAVALCG